MTASKACTDGALWALHSCPANSESLRGRYPHRMMRVLLCWPAERFRGLHYGVGSPQVIIDTEACHAAHYIYGDSPLHGPQRSDLSPLHAVSRSPGPACARACQSVSLRGPGALASALQVAPASHLRSQLPCRHSTAPDNGRLTSAWR